MQQRNLQRKCTSLWIPTPSVAVPVLLLLTLLLAASLPWISASFQDDPRLVPFPLDSQQDQQHFADIFADQPPEFGERCSNDRDLMVEECGGQLICLASSCTWCSVDEQCLSGYICSAPPEGTCEREPLFQNWRGVDTAATLLIFIGASLAAGGGLGGGGIFIPIFIMVAGLTTQEAVPMSQAAIMGGSIANLINYFPKRHPTIAEKPLIDFDVVMMLTPTLLVGTTIGVILNTIFPSWLILSLLAVSLVYGSYRTGNKARRKWKEETEARTEQGDGQVASSGSPVSGTVELMPLDQQDVSLDGKVEDQTVTADPGELKALIKEQNAPMIVLSMIFVTWAVFMVSSLLRGSKQGKPSIAGIYQCDTGFWLLTWGIAPVLFAAAAFHGRRLSQFDQAKRALGWQPQVGEISWDAKAVLVYPAIACLAGIMGGLLGIGGGMIMGPLLLEFGIHPQATSATSAAAVFLTASSAAVQFLVMGLLILDWGAWYASVGFLATITGLYGINYLVRRSGRSSIIIISIALIIVVATCMLVTSGIINIVDDAQKNRSFGFKEFCK